MTGRRLWIAGGLLAIIAILALGWLLVVSPVFDATASNDVVRSGVEQQNALQRSQIAAFGRVDQDALDKDLAALAVEFPDAVDAPGLIAEVSGAVDDSGATLTNLQISDPQVFSGLPAAVDGGAALPVPANAATTVVTGGLLVIPLQVSVNGDRDAVLAIAGRLDALPRRLLVTAVTTTAGAKPTGQLTVLAWALPDADAVKATGGTTAPPPPSPTATDSATPAPTSTDQ